jgi:hypothetical protein
VGFFFCSAAFYAASNRWKWLVVRIRERLCSALVISAIICGQLQLSLSLNRGVN